jgi:exopolysaccharide biosynthesis polyprenyl glycosylphosphotransferase
VGTESLSTEVGTGSLTAVQSQDSPPAALFLPAADELPSAAAFLARARRVRDLSEPHVPVRAVRVGPVVADRSESDSLAVVRRRERIFRRTIVGSDVAAAALAVFVAIEAGTNYVLRPGYLLVLPLIVLVAKIQGLYDHDELVIRKSTLDELPRLVNLATLVAMLVWLSRHFIVIGAPSTWTLLKTWVALLAFTGLGRMVARWLAGRLAPPERCFFVGDLRTATRLRSKLANASNVDLVGMITDDQAELDEELLLQLTREFDIHRIVVASAGGVAEERTTDLIRAAKATGLRVTICPGVLAVVGSSLVLDDVWGMPLLGVPRFGLTRSSAVLKRGFDLLGGGAVLLACSPLLAAIALLIKLDSPGPVLFRQQRVGRDGELFEIFKLRTMVDGAEEMKAELRELNEAEGIFKIGRDPRVTRIGRLLRMTSLDELPQLGNVLRGQMSLVGPRPLVVDEDEMITGLDRRRLTITPGMTGPWQILGSARIPLHEMIKLDYVYVANWSLWSDVKILVRTVRVVLAGRGL